MYLIRNGSINPRYNLAFEEFLFRNFNLPGGCLMLWQNKPSVIVGRYQNTHEEVNHEFVTHNQVEVVRRITGGGAVYHDLGNINFSFIDASDSPSIDFAAYNRKIIDALARMGVTTELNSRNDIVIEGKKFSGNAQIVHRGKVLHHGTILFNANLDNVEKALTVDSTKFESKGIKSVRSRVANLYPFLSPDISVQEFMNILLQSLDSEYSLQEYDLDAAAIKEIESLCESKYSTWAWNYGSAPLFNFSKKSKFPWGNVDLKLEVQDGIISRMKIYGDFFAIEEIAVFEEKFCGVPFETEQIQQIIATTPLSMYFGQASPEEILSCFFA